MFYIASINVLLFSCMIIDILKCLYKTLHDLIYKIVFRSLIETCIYMLI